MATKRKFILISLTALFAGVVIAVMTLPFWFPWVLRPLAQHAGATYGGYEREGYQRLVLQDITFTNSSLRIDAKRVEVLTPWEWLYDHVTGAKQTTFLTVNTWTLDVAATNEATTSNESIPDLFHELQSQLAGVRQWLPKAELIDGKVQVAGQTISVPKIVWDNGTLTGEAAVPQYQQSALLTANLSNQAPWNLEVELPKLRLRTTARLAEDATGLLIDGNVLWQTNRATWSAHIKPGSPIPDLARIDSKAFSIPAGEIHLPGYDRLHGDLSVVWQEGKFAADLAANAEPSATNATMPAVALALQLQGDTNSVAIQQLKISSPWLQAGLSKPVTLDLAKRRLSEDVSFDLFADLEKQPWAKMTGSLRGQALFHSGTNVYPEVRFRWEGDRVGGFGLGTSQTLVEGALEWPSLSISRAEISLLDGTVFQAEGTVDLEKKSVTQGTVKLFGHPGRDLMPEGYGYNQLSAVVQISGPLDSLKHSGWLEGTGIVIPKVQNPSDLSMEWNGNAGNIDLLQWRLITGDSRLSFAGAIQKNETGISGKGQTLEFTTQDAPQFQLDHPFQFSVEKTVSQNTGRWGFRLEPLHWTGPGGDVQLACGGQWPNQLSFTLNLQRIRSDLLADYLGKLSWRASIDQFAFSGGWTNGPAQFSLNTKASLNTDDGSYSTVANVSGAKEGMVIHRLEFGRDAIPIINIMGKVPALVAPATESHWFEVITNQPVDVKASVTSDRRFWRQISRMAGVRMEAPEVDLALTGPLRSPSGHIRAKAERLELRKFSVARGFPDIEHLEVTLDIDRSKIVLDQADLTIAGQKITASGEAPLGKEYGSVKNLLQWDQAKGRLRVARAELSAVSEMFPGIVSPQGRMDMDLEIRPKKQLAGYLKLEDAATRPIATLGSIRNLNARLNFSGQKLIIEDVAASIGGQAVKVTGDIDLGNRNETTGLPLLDLRVTGKDVPLVRRSDLILRSDLDVHVTNSLSRPPVITGSVQLRDSVFMSDVRTLIPGKIAAPSRRPPYFSIDAPILGDFRLRLRVKGDRFIKVRSPFFQGEASSDLTLEGTLREPFAYGEVRVNSGTVQFPFADLEVKQSLISMTSENPYRPQLQITAASRIYGYDVRMEVTGTADSPVITFSSTPGLSSEQIVLMLTAGQLPRNELTFSNQQRATQIGFFLGKSLFSRLTGGQGGADRLTIRSGEEISEQGKQTYSVEYKLDKDWSLVGEYDRFGDFNAGVKWRFFSK